METMIYVSLFVAIVVLNLLKAMFKASAKATAAQKAKEAKTGAQPKPEWTMASKKADVTSEIEINPAFLEEKNWDDYDMPSYLRKNHKVMLEKATAAETPVKATIKPAKTKSPKLSMDEFKQTVKSKADDSARYEEV